MLLFALLAACSGGATEGAAEAPTPAAPPPEAAPAPEAAPETAPAAPTRTVNLNTATAEQLAAGVPGLGPKMVHEFEEYRPYASILQFRKEMGKYVDAATIASYEQHVFVPIDVNQSDAATLQQIAGLDEAEANTLIERRPYSDYAAFWAVAQGMLTPEQQASANGMLQR